MKHINYLLIFVTINILPLLSCSSKDYDDDIDHPDAKYASAENILAENSEYLASPQAIDEDAMKSKEFSTSQSTPSGLSNYIATLAATATYDDGMHKFIRTADLKFKVKDIPQATNTIEDIILKNRGFIINSSITNQTPYAETINISKDSAIVRYYNNLHASLTLKVPYQLLDSTLREIAPLALVINHRKIEAQDVTTQLMAEKMRQSRMAKKQSRVSQAIDNKGKKLDDIVEAENILDQSLENADNAKIREYEINDQIAYSTIKISLYQHGTEYTEKIVRKNEYIKEYEEGFGIKSVDALKDGWDIICSIFLFLISIWPFIIIVTLGIIIVIIYNKPKQKQK